MNIFSKTLLGATLISSFIYASNTGTNTLQNKPEKQVPVLVVDKNSTAGQIILKSQEEYLKLLKKRIKMSQINTVALEQIRENNCEIQNIKIVLAKLIQDVEKLKKDKASKKELKALYALIEKQNEKINQLKQSLKKEKKQKVQLIEKKIDFIDRFVNKKHKDEKICRVVKVPVYKTQFSLKDISKSYVKYSTPKEFVAQADLLQYNYPLLWAKTDKYPAIKKGTHFKGDMWTYAGWVHVQGQGWVRGFLLYPKVLQKKSMFKKKPIKYIEKIICKTK